MGFAKTKAIQRTGKTAHGRKETFDKDEAIAKGAREILKLEKR